MVDLAFRFAPPRAMSCSRRARGTYGPDPAQLSIVNHLPREPEDCVAE